jgi:hypothetical protein
MLYMIVNRTRTDLSGEDFQRLEALAKAFYGTIPEGMRILGDWAATDGSRTFALVDVQDPALLEQVQAPFRPYVDMESAPVQPLSGWRA